MSNVKYNTTLDTTGFTYNLYNEDIKLKSTYGDFTLPAWTVENFDTNSIWKSRYQLSANETWDDLTEEQKETLRKEVFKSWSETIWSIIRQRIGLTVDIIGWHQLDKSQQENIRLAIAQQINNWRINLPYEINNNVSRVSGNLQTTINASAFTIGFDILSQQTKQSITATGLDRYDYTDLLTKCYREDTLLVEVKTNKERISQLEENKVENILPENLLTRTEAANIYEKIGGGYITKAEADSLYLKNVNLVSLSTGGYFVNENKISDTPTTKSLTDTTSSRELKITTSSDSLTYQFLNNNNIERSYNFDRGGLTIDNQQIPTSTSILNSIRNLYYSKDEIDTKETNLNNQIISEDNKSKDALRSEIASKFYNAIQTNQNFYKKSEIDRDLYSKNYIDGNFYTRQNIDEDFYQKSYINSNYYEKQEVDQKIAAAAGGGTIDLSNYYSKNEMVSLFYNKVITDETFVNREYLRNWIIELQDVDLLKYSDNFTFAKNTEKRIDVPENAKKIIFFFEDNIIRVELNNLSDLYTTVFNQIYCRKETDFQLYNERKQSLQLKITQDNKRLTFRTREDLEQQNVVNFQYGFKWKNNLTIDRISFELDLQRTLLTALEEKLLNNTKPTPEEEEEL